MHVACMHSCYMGAALLLSDNSNAPISHDKIATNHSRPIASTWVGTVHQYFGLLRPADRDSLLVYNKKRFNGAMGTAVEVAGSLAWI